MNSLNEAYATRSTRHRYEVWFLRVGLADESGAWWFRYLLLNPARYGCSEIPNGMPVQVWATWFPSQGKPQSFIQGFPVDGLQLSPKAQSPFRFQVADNWIDDNSCQGALQVDGRAISWDLRFRSTYRFTMSTKGWIGFTRTPHSDAIFSGTISLDGRTCEGSPLGFGVQGHNCGYRHRKFWRWAHAYFPRSSSRASTFEALIYEMPLGLVFRKAVLWHRGTAYIFRNLAEIAGDPEQFGWRFRCSNGKGLCLQALFDGAGAAQQSLPYMKTNCSGSFQVMNNSLASARLQLETRDSSLEILETNSGAVLEKAGIHSE